MTRAHVLELVEAPAPRPRQRFGDDGPKDSAAPAISSAVLAVILLMGSEVMLFLGLMGAFVLYRVSSVAWPPPGQPLLPIGVTFLNSVVLLASALTMHRAYLSLKSGNLKSLRSGLAATAVMGVTFLAVQGFEWARLIQYGLTLSSSTYGATFYSLIGMHALHVLAAVVWLCAVLVGAWRGRYSPQNHVGVQVCGIYWGFVCALWLVLFGVVYLA